MFVCSVTIKITASDVLLINFSIDRIFLFVCSFQGTNGDGEIRTHDPLLARQVLSQLSYTPIYVGAHLLSHTVSSIVSSAAQVLTIVFGMGTGVTPERISTNNL